MTRQEIFNFVSTHLFTQGERSTTREKCLYRTEDGLSCAVGCLLSHLSDEQVQELDNKSDASIDVVSYDFMQVLPSYFKDEITFLETLQVVHDVQSNWKTSEDMRKSLNDVASWYSLDSSILETLSFVDGR